jgi:hypothetical protein
MRTSECNSQTATFVKGYFSQTLIRRVHSVPVIGSSVGIKTQMTCIALHKDFNALRKRKRKTIVCVTGEIRN